MRAITLKAHYDGKHICLDEPYDLEPEARLVVTVISGSSPDDERADWLAASQAGLRHAYGDDEPDYSTAVLRDKPTGQ